MEDLLIKQLLEYVKGHGLAAAMCAIALIWIGRLLSKFITWAEPKATEIVKAHCSLVDALEANLPRQTKLLERQSEQIDDIHRAVVPDSNRLGRVVNNGTNATREAS